MYLYGLTYLPTVAPSSKSEPPRSISLVLILSQCQSHAVPATRSGKYITGRPILPRDARLLTGASDFPGAPWAVLALDQGLIGASHPTQHKAGMHAQSRW